MHPYQRIVADLTAAITTGTLPPGATAPSAAELMRTYRVARMTARRALNELHDAGLLDVKQGTPPVVRGTPAGNLEARVAWFEAELATIREKLRSL